VALFPPTPTPTPTHRLQVPYINLFVMWYCSGYRLNSDERNRCWNWYNFLRCILVCSEQFSSVEKFYSSSIRDCLISLYLSFCHFSVIIHITLHSLAMINTLPVSYSIALHPHLSVYIAVNSISSSPRPPWGSSFGHKFENSSSLSVCIICYGLDGPEIESGWRRDFPHPSSSALGLTQPPVQWVRGLFLGG